MNLRAQEIHKLADDKLVIHDFLLYGNNVTHEKIILREIIFSPGDTIRKIDLIPAIQRSRENLMNTSLFNFVHFDIQHLENSRIDVLITVTERWYIWPVPIIEYADRNFSSFLQNREWDKINYGMWLKWNNFRGRNQVLAAKIRLGYVKEYTLQYDMPNLGKSQKHKLSLGISLNHQNEIYVSTFQNEPVEYSPPDPPAQARFTPFISYTFRRKYYTYHTLRFQYYDYRVSDSVAVENTMYLGDAKTRSNYFQLSYTMTYDARDSKIYPLEGFKLQVRADKLGLGFISSFDYPHTRLEGILMFHQKLAQRFYFYNTMKARVSTEKILPHFLNSALGYWEFLSAYEPYVIDGSDYVISKYGLRFQLVKPSIYTIPYIPYKQFNKIHYAFYLTVFADVGYVRNDFPGPTNTMTNSLLNSVGIGLDFVTYYDQVFRINYAINRDGEHGFFFHVETPFYRW